MNPVGRWRLDERGELIARGIATGGDMVKESTESPVRERKEKKKRLGQRGKGGERRDKGRGRTKRPGGFVCWHSQP